MTSCYRQLVRSAVLATVATIVGCGQSSPAPPALSVPIVVDGSEHVAWGQVAQGGEDLSSYRFLAYVDGVAHALPDATCRSGSDASQFDCSAKLPRMAAGRHQLRISAVIELNGARAESPQSAAVDLLILPPPSVGAASVNSNFRTVAATADRTDFSVQTLATGLDVPSGIATTPDGRVFIAERAGAVRVWQNNAVLNPPALQVSDAARGADVGLLGIAVDPDFASNGEVYLAYIAQSVDGALSNRVVRFREVNNILAQAAVIFEDPVTALPQRTPRVRFGPDGKLYVAFPGDLTVARDRSTYVGKVLRLNSDGTTPKDNPQPSPIISGDQGVPFAFGWQPRTNQLWQVDREWGDMEALRRLDVASAPGSAALYFKPAIDPSAASFYTSTAIETFTGDLFVAALTGQDIQRVRFDPLDPGRVVGTERLLDGEFGRVGDLTLGADGALYFCTSNRGVANPAAGDDRLVRIAPLPLTAAATAKARVLERRSSGPGASASAR
jgi:glucose/arabinose dehydrogenase